MSARRRDNDIFGTLNGNRSPPGLGDRHRYFLSDIDEYGELLLLS
jgi:hypothetical protein